MHFVPFKQLCFSLALMMFVAGCESKTMVEPSVENKATETTTEVTKTESGDKHAHVDGKTEEQEIKEALAKLSPEDQKLAAEQGYCVIGDGKLGSMGTPVKLMIEEQPVFVCCDHCTEKAKADPKATLAKVDEMKKKTAAEHGTPVPATTTEKPAEAPKAEANKTEVTKPAPEAEKVTKPKALKKPAAEGDGMSEGM
jgi:hypothetical protein